MHGRKRGEKAKEDGRWKRGREGFLTGAPGPASWVEWVALGMRCACDVHFPGGRGWLRGTLAWSTTVTSWLWGPSHLIALIPFSPCVTWNGTGSPLGWIVGANAALPVGSAPSRARERQKGSGPGACRSLREQGVLGQVGVLAPPWARVTCEGGFSRQGAAEGRGARGPGWCLVLGGVPLASRARCAVLGRGVGAPSPPGPVQWRGGREGGRQGLITETLFPQLSETCPGALQLGLPWVGCCPFPTRGVLGQVHLSPGLAEVVPGPCPLPLGIPGARFKALLPSQLFCDVLSVFRQKKKWPLHGVLLNVSSLLPPPP
ncbi:uncharacterized protein LOC122455316 [Cervus canadensis]|uniref:uncharacterized protein LOC122455316 n=1 Tax=Cervus canadensis TaxID=1574408 RepID=UPI001C9E6CFF|nr:uncharacterized protein LOC122455316 [Cervus canadensis]XP_043346286.1 uncharacterized protein LOC122455316 [Cervus canadensis]XP_043346287.1 uncharacterized protein LOC122455316 [Cervus canadensis]XP_043346288.1 uncharacterized protein LOC122455316 [Cervus canadensis]XP_043346289.1 uncharacterized protein LOC122455316 [Cervus canadensis]